ncbi:MAG: oxidative damage protection protein [Gammaproteobacteria bacterium]
MTRIIHCIKLNKDAEGLTKPPIPGELGNRIYEQVSAEAWQLWIQHQTMLINEYRLSMLEAKSRAFLRDEMEKFLFGDGSEKPAGYVPTE